ncbi:hypothetical protein [Burkholderia sp. Ax-1724]|uniref:hypothetical protein n=1 Tax=Burkholderia sp. Ax-1724 TaxID=2608336 RepID=UPI001422F3D0|nr:hypothetical protein [Burkholderia sp. Ax-1724]NIF55557.1 hypothetical protein [Burkholderia sp. Ax-1724]
MQELNQLKSSEHKSDKPTCTPESNFSSLIKSAINLGSGYRQRSREIAAVHYAAAHKYHTDESNRGAYEEELKKLCVENKIEVTPGKTSPYHKIVRLTFTDATKQYVSDKVHVLSVALAKQIEPENFLVWLENERGERKIVETYRRDGSCKQNPTNNDDQDVIADDLYREHNRNMQAQRARQHSVVFVIDAATASQVLPKLQIDTECAAIIARQTDGSFVIKAVVADRDIAEDVYVGYYRINSHVIDSAVKQRQIAEILESTDDLSVADIRKKLGDEIANKAVEAARQVSEFNREMSRVPDALRRYVELLKKADVAFAANGDASHYEGAMEELEQVLEDDQSLQGRIDRPFDRTANLCPDNMPRHIGSKSRHAMNTLTTTKQNALRRALEIEYAIFPGIESRT